MQRGFYGARAADIYDPCVGPEVTVTPTARACDGKFHQLPNVHFLSWLLCSGRRHEVRPRRENVHDTEHSCLYFLGII